MRLVHVAAAVLNQTPLDWEGNAARIRAAIDEARARRASVLCLPEMCVSGYGCEDAFFGEHTRAMAWRMLEELVPATRGMLVTLGLPVMHQASLFNATAVAIDGKLVGIVAKQHLAGDGVHYEPRWFRPWPARAVVHLEGGVPLGDLVFDVGGVRVGFEICEDAWVARRPGGELVRRGVDLILNPSASHFAFGKHATRKALVTEGSRAFGVAYVYSNLLGNEAGRIVYDGGALIATEGALLAAGPRFAFRDHVVTDAIVDIDANRTRRAQAANPLGLVADDPGCVDVTFHLPEPPYALPDAVVDPWPRHTQEEELTRAIALGLYDYGRKSRQRGFVVSLSGGADSTACACLVRIMLDLACADNDVATVGRAFGHPEATSAAGLAPHILTTVYQATRNSSATTRHAARTVAQALSARHLELDVDALVQGYIGIVEGALGRSLTWEGDDIALQNIQARARAPGVWMIANLSGALLLATSNRSEAAVGYATMDGDTSGGISPIAGIDKPFLRRWLRWLETTGPTGVGPIPAVAVVNALAPTAELRPPAQEQTDEGDLMPYDVLDAVEEEAIGRKRAPAEVLEVIAAQWPDHPRPLLAAWVARFFRLWSQNQWKRERYAPSFHLDDRNLDPKTWCRYPILSGGHRLELDAMVADEEE